MPELCEMNIDSPPLPNIMQSDEPSSDAHRSSDDEVEDDDREIKIELLIEIVEPDDTC